jgi:hypothetical protein
MTDLFVASASARVAECARRLLANELDGDELGVHLARVDALAGRVPIGDIAVRTQIAETLVTQGLGPVFLR